MNKWKQQQTHSWTKPILVFLGCLFTITLIVPTLIVVPNSQPKPFAKQLQTTTNELTKEEQPVSLQENDSPITIDVYRTEQQKVEKIQLEDYVVGVVSAEMPSSFELEALKAQALAARTLIIKQIESKSPIAKKNNADITDNPNFHQIYKNNDELAKQWGTNYESNLDKIKNAVKATKGKILTYKEEPIEPSFFSTSNGYTENSEDYWEEKLPYLRSVESTWDKESPKYLQQTIIPIDDIEKKLKIKLDPNINNIGEKTLTKSNRVKKIKIGNKELSGREVRETLNLPSNDFDVQQKDKSFIFTTRGYGHGVGMSQYGANHMAKEGKTYEEIINYYYKEIEIKELESFTELVKK